MIRANQYLVALTVPVIEMSPMDAQKLAKVLALAASDNEAEAVHALRTARRLLEGHGLDFVALAARLNEGGDEALKDAVFDLRNEVRHLRAENEKLRQSRPGAAAPPANLADAARDAAELIRLRSELDQARAEVQRVHDHQENLQEQFRQALAEAGQLGLRLSEAETRRMRLEAENRRLSHANHALKVDLAAAQAQTQAVAAPVAVPVPQLRSTVSEMMGGDRKRGKTAALSTKGVGQYVLF